MRVPDAIVDPSGTPGGAEPGAGAGLSWEGGSRLVLQTEGFSQVRFQSVCAEIKPD